MSLKNNPSYAWMFASATDSEPPKDGLVEWVTTDGMFSQKRFSHSDPKAFCDRVNSTWVDPVEAYRLYADGVLNGLDRFKSEMRVFAEMRAREMLGQVETARQAKDCAFLLALTHLHYLHREIEILRIFIPLAKSKLSSQRKIINMSPEAQQAAKDMHQQWRDWASALVENQPELNDNKFAIAEELKRLHNIKQAVGTIRKKI